MARALIHIHRASNLGAALPFAHALRHGSPWDLAISVTPHDPESHVGLPGMALSRVRRLGIPILEKPSDANAQVTFTFDPVESQMENCGLLVRVPSGVRGAGKRFSPLPAGNVDNLADLVLVPGQWHADRLRDGGNLFAPTEIVGLPSLDPLTANWLPDREQFCRQLQVDPTRNIILYAPTHEPELSAVPLLWTRIATLADERNLLIVRLHPASSPEMVKAHELLAQRHPHVMIARETDVQPYLRLANVVVTDVSTIAFEAAAIGTGVVLFDNPNRFEYPGFDRTDPEHSFRALFPRASDLESLHEQVQHLIAHPSAMTNAIQEIRTRLIRVDDGIAINRVIEATARLMQKRQSSAQSSIPATVLIPVDPGDEMLVKPTVESIYSQNGVKLRTVLMTHGADHAQLEEVLKLWPDSVEIFAEKDPLKLEHELAGAPFTVLIHPGIQGEHRWLLRLLNHLRRHTELAGVVPLMPGAAPSQDPRTLLHMNLAPGSSLHDLDRTLSVEQAGVTLRAVATPRLDVTVLRSGSETWRHTIHNLSTGKLEGSHSGIWVAADVVMTHPAWLRPPVWERMVPLTRREIAETEKRIRELSEWVGRIIPVTTHKPANGINTPAPAAPAKVSQGNDNADGRLRLAMHYEKRGDHGTAVRHLKSFLADHPDDSAALELAKQLGYVPEPVN